MALSSRPSSPRDRHALTKLMAESLSLRPSAIALDARFQDWKYWEAHPYWAGSRGRVLEDGDKMVAHGCAWPIRLLGTEGELNALHLVDWAASPDAPGAGVRALGACSEGAAACLAIGGTSQARRVTAAFGFKPANSIRFLARSIRPVRRALSSSPLNWKLPARIARELVRFRPAARSLPPGWTLERVTPRQIPESMWPRPEGAEMLVSRRDAALLEHMLRCPAAQGVETHLLLQGGRPAAYVLVVLVPGAARLADYGLAPRVDAEECGVAMGVALQGIATAAKGCCVATAATTEALVQRGLERAGFRVTRDEVIQVWRKATGLTGFSFFRLTSIDYDAAFLH